MTFDDAWDIAKKMMQLYRSETLRKDLGMKATERAIRVFDWSIIKKQWVDFFKTCVIQESDIPAEWAKLYSETK